MGVMPEGNVRWQREVRGVDHMISDSAGGTIIATDYSYDEETLFIIKIDSEGNFSWGEDGIYVRREGYCDHSLGLASDSNGGAIFIWHELGVGRSYTQSGYLLLEPRYRGLSVLSLPVRFPLETR